MLLVTTPTGNTGAHVLSRALASNAGVRVLVRDAGKLAPATRERCEIVQGDLHDTAALSRAAQGVRAAFYCVPQSGESDDVTAYYRSFAEPAAAAFARVERVVTISGGRGEPADIGPSGPLAAMEKAFDRRVASTRHLRCGYFMENFFYMVPELRFHSAFSLPLDPGYPLSLEAAEDIGREAARWLVDESWTGHEGVRVPHGEILSCREIAQKLGEVLGKPIAFRPITGEEYASRLVGFGVSQAMATSLREMFADIAHGSIGGADKTKEPGGVTFEAWAQARLVPALQ